MRYIHIILFTFFLLILKTNEIKGQELPNPFDFPILLSGNFGELRSNHFHAGIDFKTQGAEGKAIHAVQDGYISRISISPGGYGNGLYLTHPDGTTTVYGHLLRFPPVISDYIKEEQYKQESFNVNLIFSPDQFPVKRGEIIAWSGNTGSSAGPHLHFEIRDTESQELIDPIIFFKKQIKDSTPPRIQGIMVYSIEGEGVVNGNNKKKELNLAASKRGASSLNGKIEAWGKIGLAVKAYDYMDNTSNIYGVKGITLLLDDEVIFHSCIDRYSLDESRYLNSFTDYADWIDRRSFYMKSFIEPGNRLRFLNAKDRGYIYINEERTYQLKYILKDAYDNTTELPIEIHGKVQQIPKPGPDTEHFYWYGENKFGAKGIRLAIPQGNLYSDLYFKYNVRKDSAALADTHMLHNTPVPLHKNARLSLRLQNDPLENKNQYGIVRIRKGRTAWVGGTYRNGWIDGSIRELGQYTLGMDTVKPVIVPIDPDLWVNKGQITFRLTDNLSGIKTYQGKIDGEYVLFEMDNRSVIRYTFDKKRLSRGTHELTLHVTDGCGNEALFSKTFIW